MRPKHRAQAGVKQVGTAVVARRVHATSGVNVRRHPVAQRNISLLHHATLDYQACHRTLRVLHPHRPVGACDCAPVSQLSAALGVEGRPAQHQFDLLPLRRVTDGVQCAGVFVRNEQRNYHRFFLDASVANEAGFAGSQVFVDGEHFHAADKGRRRPGPGLLPLGLHFPLEPLHVHFQTVLSCDFGGQLRREAVGIVQNKGLHV